MHEHDHIRAHIAALAGGGDEADGLTLIGRIHRACWPGGEQDRTVPSARRWLSSWRPARMTVAPAACSCADGRCLVCN
jgi:hypothetical protein